MRFNDYDKLSKYISELAPPEPGHVRVFRGQYKDHGNLRPTGVRNPMHNEHIWRRYCDMLTAGMLMREGVDFTEAFSRSGLWSYWYYAIVQHYGPGTHLLDVTHALDVALWFALHKASTDTRIDLRYDGPDIISHGPSLHRKDEWTTYQEWNETPGVIYIFDVTEWNSEGTPGHGMLVDLEHAPNIFHRSTRIGAQKACLIAADVNDPSGGDLWKFLRFPPIEVEWPMTGCTTVNLETEVLFPGPKQDDWYAFLLFLPIVHQVWNKEPYWRMAHPVELSLYIAHLPESIYAIQFKPLQPPLLYPWLNATTLQRKITSEKAYEQAALILQTTPILLEAPVLPLLHEYNYTSRNHKQFIENLPTSQGFIEWVSNEISGDPVYLTNVFFELSPLERVDWAILLKKNGKLEVPRAIHLVREGTYTWRLQLFSQIAPKEKIILGFPEPVSIRFDNISNRLQIEDGDHWADISANSIAENSFILALVMLNAVSTGDQHKSYLESYRTAPAILKKTPDLGLDISYYVIRDLKTNDPYTFEEV